MEAEFFFEALEEALAKHGKPEIFNTALRAAKLGQRESVAHMPTAEAEDTAQSCMIGFGKT